MNAGSRVYIFGAKSKGSDCSWWMLSRESSRAEARVVTLTNLPYLYLVRDFEGLLERAVEVRRVLWVTGRANDTWERLEGRSWKIPCVDVHTAVGYYYA